MVGVVSVSGYWCPKCGMVRFDLLRPLCRHGVPDSSLRVEEMADLPRWHPLAAEV